MEKKCSVCVTGGAGYIGSYLVKKLLQKGYTVHATLRNLDDLSKVGLLKGLDGADGRLKLFKADIYNPEEFEAAIAGCTYVFHVATPKLHYTESTKFKDTAEAAVAGARNIVNHCIKSGTVKRLVYTASVTSASPLKEDGSDFKSSIDECCWTPLQVPWKYSLEFEQAYVCSKTLSEKEILSHSNIENGGLEVVSLVCGLVGGGTITPHTPLSVEVITSQLTTNESPYRQLKFLQGLLNSVPLVHIEDVCEAHVFCIDQPSMSGRFLCAQAFPTIREMANYFNGNYKEFKIPDGFAEGPEKGIICTSKKLEDMGFEYKFDMKSILDDSVECARKMGVLDQGNKDDN